MNVIYKCRCMKQERSISVPDRVAGSDLGEWMEFVQACMGYDHAATNAASGVRCNAYTTEYVKIAVPDGTKELGRPVVKQ